MQDLELTEEQVMIRDMARDFARREIAPHAQAWEKAGLPLKRGKAPAKA